MLEVLTALTEVVKGTTGINAGSRGVGTDFPAVFLIFVWNTDPEKR